MKVTLPRAMTARPTVTVVVPCYKYGHFLPHMVDSVLSQDGVDARVIIVDDASPDDSAEVALRLAAADSRVTALIHEQNTGHIATYNDGLALVETEFVSLVSADDVIAPGALARATGLMAAHPSVGLVYGHAGSFSGDAGETIKAPKLPNTWTVWRGPEWIRWAARRGRNFILSPEVVLRTAALRELGGYNPELPHSGDLEYWLRTAARWDIGRVNGSSQAYYRVHGANMHLTQFATMAVDLHQRLAAFDVLAGDDIRNHLPGGEALLARAKKAVAREARILATRELDAGAVVASVRPLLDFADEIHPTSGAPLSARMLRWRITRADDGKKPALVQRTAERWRRQVDRLRWRAWEEIGIS